MKESFWMLFFLFLGIFGFVLINFTGQMTISNEQNYYLLKELTEASMIDAVDYRAFREGVGYDGVTQMTDPDSMHCIAGVPGTVRIVKEKMVESFVRRFAENVELNKSYQLRFEDIDECPPKVTVTLISKQTFDFFGFFNSTYNSDSSTDVVNRLNAILEVSDYRNETEAD